MKIIINKKTVTNNIASLVIVFYYSMRSALVFQSNSIFTYIALILGVIAFILSFFMNKKIKFKLILSLLFIYLLMTISALVTGNIDAGVIFNFQFIGITLLMLNTKLNTKIIGISFYAHSIIMFIFIVNGVNPENVLVYSRNQISSILIVQTVLFYLSKMENEHEISFIPAILTLIISGWAMGRSGIISSIILLIAVFMKRKSNKFSNIKQITVIVVIILSSVFILPESVGNIVQNVQTNIDFASRRLSSEGLGARTLIIKEYLRIAGNDVSGIIFGGKIQESAYLQTFMGNLHISYLGIHAFYGIAGVIFISILLANSIKSIFENKWWFALGLYLSLLIRVSTDTLAFPGYYDPLVYFFIFYSYSRLSKTEKQTSKKNLISESS